eukprot:GHVL01027888.1.p1 GENE.GHVL01027888.1~~GHVL01027888.1.p1  ORF type:complete len:785 (+),score=153.05 GHVL01027888.1:312-2357(+)
MSVTRDFVEIFNNETKLIKKIKLHLSWPIKIRIDDIVTIVQIDSTKDNIKLLYCRDMNLSRVKEVLNYYKIENERLELKCSLTIFQCPYLWRDIIHYLETEFDNKTNIDSIIEKFSIETDNVLTTLLDLLSDLTNKCTSSRLGGIMIPPIQIYEKMERINNIEYGHTNPCLCIIQNIVTQKLISTLLPAWVFSQSESRLQFALNLLMKIVDLLPLYSPYIRLFINVIPPMYFTKMTQEFITKILYRLMDCVCTLKGNNDNYVTWKNLPTMPCFDGHEEVVDMLPSMKTIFFNASDYQETIYRLLRAHCFYKMRKAIYNLKINHSEWDPRDLNSFKIRVKKVKMEKNVSGILIEVCVHPYRIKYFNEKLHHYQRAARPRDLMNSNLVCICLEALEFKSDNLILAVVHKQNSFKNRTNNMVTTLQLLDDISLPNTSRSTTTQMKELMIRRGQLMWMFESPVFYTAYKTPLEVLRTKPLENISLINFIMGVSKPERTLVLDYPVLSPELDESQIAAVMDALTSPFSIIQGPPGTGKSHVGLELLRLLFTDKAAIELQNRFLKNNEESDDSTRASSLGDDELIDDRIEDIKNIKVLWISYKNHITDELLKKTLQKGILSKNEICRLGGRCDDSLQHLSLRSKSRAMGRESCNRSMYICSLEESINHKKYFLFFFVYYNLKNSNNY